MRNDLSNATTFSFNRYTNKGGYIHSYFKYKIGKEDTFPRNFIAWYAAKGSPNTLNSA
jgi:hypothetical protein